MGDFFANHVSDALEGASVIENNLLPGTPFPGRANCPESRFIDQIS